MARRRRPAPEPPAGWPPLKLLELRAPVSDYDARGGRTKAGQTEMCEMLDVSDQTLRNYARRGMPVRHTGGGKPEYDIGECMTWVLCMRDLMKKGRQPRHLTSDEATDWHLAWQARNDSDRGHFLLVPMDHDHPLRERQLRRAAEGIKPAPLDDDDEPDDED